MNCFNNLSKLINSVRDNLIATANRFISMSASTNSSQNRSVLIFLHGLGDQGSSWRMQLAPMMPGNVKCICPTAPIQAVTLNMGMQMNSWFDLRSLDPGDPEDEDGIESASKKIHELIAEQEKQGIPHDRIMLGGFSQGGALALYAAFTYPKKLAGVVALSCWLPMHQKISSIITESTKTTPVLQCHGDSDFIVPFHWGKMSERVMSTFLDKSTYKFKVYAGLGHSSSVPELNDVLEFVKNHLAS